MLFVLLLQATDTGVESQNNEEPKNAIKNKDKGVKVWVTK